MSNTGLTLWRQGGATLSKRAGDVAVIKIDDLYHIIDVETGGVIGGNISTLKDALRDIPWAKRELKLTRIPKYKDAVKKKKRKRRKKKQDGKILQKRKARGKKLDMGAGSVPDWRTATVARKRKRRAVGHVGGVGVTGKDSSYPSVPLLEARSGGDVVLLETDKNLKRGCLK